MLLIKSRILSKSSSLKYSISIDPVLLAFEFKCTLVPKIEISSFSIERTALFFANLETHLHFEIWKDGEPADPLLYFPELNQTNISVK